MENEVILGNVMVDCDDEKKLQKFYGELLGWESQKHNLAEVIL